MSHGSLKSGTIMSCLVRHLHVPGNDTAKKFQNSGLLCRSERRVHNYLTGGLGKEKGASRDLVI